MAAAAQRVVFIVNIEQGSESEGLFNGMYGRLVGRLKNRGRLSVTTVDSIKLLQAKCAACSPKETVLLFTNEVIAKRTDLHDMLKHFVSAGGLAIIGCLFSSFTTPQMTDTLFHALGLQWKNADCYRTTFGLTDMGQSLLTEVSTRYSAMAGQLSDVPNNQKLYKPVPDATTESEVFSVKPADANLVLAAFGKVGKGAVAYIGDMNAEDESDRLIIALCMATW
ncbi:hypothetical protein HA402_008396 [Bradysia odoriphaga]|nr:hypothetical protein HA402_008396 [Bradysia odoriphaga]